MTRKKSQKRQRTEQVNLRFLPGEKAKASALADKAGLALAAFARAAIFGDAGPRAQRRPPADTKLLREVLGLHNKFGANMNQIARELNRRGSPIPHGLTQALKEWRQIRDAHTAALGITLPEPAP